MSIASERALRTIGGAITYNLQRYNSQLLDMHREQLCSYLAVGMNEVYSIEPTVNGFKYSTKKIDFEYSHHYLHDKRTVKINRKNNL